MKVLVIAHGHPDFSIGGAELAAYNLFDALKNKPQVDTAYFLARTDMASINHGAITMRRPGEYLWRQDLIDWFKLRTHNVDAVHAEFREFLLTKRPDVIFMHHYVHLGVEIMREIRHTLPQCKLLLTLHEYAAICNRNGQMVKNKTNRFCYRESIQDCHACFPEFTPEDFWMRRHYVQRHFEAADGFVSPSHFLLDRYVEWGIPRDRIWMIENGQPAFDSVPQAPSQTARTARVGYFGQITEYKGVDVLLNAVHQMQPEARMRLSLEIHAAKLEMQGSWLVELIDKLRLPLIAEGTLRWVGPYERTELHRRMSKVDWVVVPSIWWENSPMVIQEAFACGRPVICSNIGGMAEKVRDGVDGLHFEARNALDLAEVLTRVVNEPQLATELGANTRQPMTYSECADAYLGLVA
jgi:glycosyltransferase involved in cell wall biosynthesis